MPEAVFLEDLIVRDAALDTLAEVMDGRRKKRDRGWRYLLRNRCRQRTPGLEGR
jgi:hypothetical protein